MNKKPRIVVLKMREIIYTVMLLLLVLLLIICLVLMFSGKAKKSSAPGEAVQQSTSIQDGSTKSTEDNSNHLAETATYKAGIYTTPVTLGDSTVDVEVTVDKNHINAIRLVNLSETTAAAYPLVSPSLEHIASQILERQGLEGITCPQENRYTSQILLSAISEALLLAQNTN